ncbi:magnesium transporter [Limimonas halophila]|uniref:Magnesium transporter MgtE n=1 Tax=Limimonas halophila TaxID=1082479 RepID=A0A1G7RET6_9PROT|nr:magnesium transporter [Limimonas halophila]SDG09273.1 magnesium transporter [Limimonas halophila]
MLLQPERMRAYAERVADLIGEERYAEAAREATNLSHARVAEILMEDAPRRAVVPFLERWGRDRAALTLAELPDEFAAELVAEADRERATDWLAGMPTDVAADIVAELDGDTAEPLLADLPAASRASVQRLSRYEEDSAGAWMSPYFVAVPLDKSVGEVIEALRAAPHRHANTAYVYVVDEQQRLVGVVSLRELMLSPATLPVRRLMKRDILVARTGDNAAEAADRTYTRGLKMLPVVTEADALVGVLTMEDALELLSEQLADELSGIGATSREESFFTPPWRAIQLRLPWMAANVFLNLAAVSIISAFEATLAQVAILAAFLPMITDMGGNVGIQALSVSIRSIALGEVRLRDYWQAVRKELAIGVVNGLALGALFGVIAYAMEANALLGGIAGAALAVNVLVAGVVGGTIPFFIRRIGLDPAMLTGPILTTVTDITGVSIYLGLASLVLAGLVA